MKFLKPILIGICLSTALAAAPVAVADQASCVSLLTGHQNSRRIQKNLRQSLRGAQGEDRIRALLFSASVALRVNGKDFGIDEVRFVVATLRKTRALPHVWGALPFVPEHPSAEPAVKKFLEEFIASRLEDTKTVQEALALLPQRGRDEVLLNVVKQIRQRDTWGLYQEREERIGRLISLMSKSGSEKTLALIELENQQAQEKRLRDDERERQAVRREKAQERKARAQRKALRDEAWAHVQNMSAKQVISELAAQSYPDQITLEVFVANNMRKISAAEAVQFAQLTRSTNPFAGINFVYDFFNKNHDRLSVRDMVTLDKYLGYPHGIGDLYLDLYAEKLSPQDAVAVMQFRLNSEAAVESTQKYVEIHIQSLPPREAGDLLGKMGMASDVGAWFTYYIDQRGEDLGPSGIRVFLEAVWKRQKRFHAGGNAGTYDRYMNYYITSHARLLSVDDVLSITRSVYGIMEFVRLQKKSLKQEDIAKILTSDIVMNPPEKRELREMMNSMR